MVYQAHAICRASPPMVPGAEAAQQSDLGEQSCERSLELPKHRLCTDRHSSHHRQGLLVQLEAVARYGGGEAG